MTYEEKGKWIYLITSILGFLVYGGILLDISKNTPITEVAYATPLLWIIGTAIVTTIIGQIIIAVAKPAEADKKDERDKDINRLGDFVGSIVLGVATMLPFALTLAKFDHFWIANAMYGAFLVSAIVGTTVKLVAYRRG